MSQPIALGSVLGGRYKVDASLLSTADDDHVLQGEDEILRRRVSILVPGASHEGTVVDNARSLAAGAGHSGFQVLDMGQTEGTTYLVTSYAPASDLLDALIFADEDPDEYSLSDDIFGDPRAAGSGSYVYQEPEPTQPHRRVSGGEEQAPSEEPAVTRWEASDYDDYDSAPPAPRVRSRLGRVRRARPEALRSTLFDRAASRAGSGSAAVAPGEIDPSYDGDNRYESFERTEGRPDRLEEPRPETSSASSDSGAASSEPATAAPVAAATAGAAASGSTGELSDRGPAHGADETPERLTENPQVAGTEGSTASPETSGAHPAAPAGEHDRRTGPLRWLLLLLLAIALLAAIVWGFRGLGALTGQFAQQGAPQQSAAPGGGQSGSPAASASPSPSAPAEVASVQRVTPDPGFMTDTDATLNQATDGNPSTYWLSYGFSNAQFGNLTEYVGLAAELEEPAAVQELSIQQANGSGGQFTVYVSDEPSFDGAQEVGKGSFTGPEIRVPLSDAARSTPHRYVLVRWTELPQLTSPIGGYPFGLRIGEVSVR